MLLSRAWWPLATDGEAADPVPANRAAPASPAPPSPARLPPSPPSPGVRYTAILLDEGSRAGLLSR
jgi:hypothetical protein